MRHWLSFRDWTSAELSDLVSAAAQIKQGHGAARLAALRGKILTMIFFNPSLRTRASFEAGMIRGGGHAITLNVGGDTWSLEHRDGVVMDGAPAEHIREAAPVLSRYGDGLAIRTFAEMKDATVDAQDHVIRSFARFATVPVINMESAIEHPCQGLADWLTLREKIAGRDGDLRGKKFLLTWAPHIKPLPLAVPHSALLAATAAGCDVTVAHPPGYELNAAIVQAAQAWSREHGAKLEFTQDQTRATRSADAVYVKSWGATGLYADTAAQKADFCAHADWTVRAAKLGTKTQLMHCLPVRRNVVISDDALDDPRSVVVDQAENRLWAQLAILSRIWTQ